MILNCAIIILIACCRFILSDKLHMLWRSGDRTPLTRWPLDGSEWALGLQALTPLGMQQQFELGCLLRNKYSCNMTTAVFDQIYNSTQVKVRSADTPRALQSALSNVVGLFPFGRPGVTIPSYGYRWPARWQPVPVSTQAVEQDTLFGTASCLIARSSQATFTAAMLNYNTTQSENIFFNFLANRTGLTTVDLTNIAEVYDSLYVQLLYNRLPTWATPGVINRAQNLTRVYYTDYYKYLTTDPTISILRGGIFLSQMIARINSLTNCLSNQTFCGGERFYAYSGHMDNLIWFLSTMINVNNLLSGTTPLYASAIVVELWQRDDDATFDIEVLYRSGPGDLLMQPITTLIGQCPTTGRCPLQVFLTRSAPFIPSDWVAQCSGGSNTNSNAPATNNAADAG